MSREQEYEIRYSEKDLKHASLLKDLAVMCRSSKKHFTVTDRLDVIREKLKNTEYVEYVGDVECAEHPAPFSLWSKGALGELPKDVVLVSSHADIVPSISVCSSTLREDGFYSGTYDNIGTNAAALILMTEQDLPSNVVFAFTGDEETGGCKGAKGAAKLLSMAGKNPICIALDVTYEGFYDNVLCSIENCTAPKEFQNTFLNCVADAALSTEGEKQSFCFVAAKKGLVPENLDDKYVSPQTGMYDEAFAYRDKGYPALSFCLPCNGSMHSNSGVMVKQPVFEGYILSLEALLCELTKERKENAEDLKQKKDKLVSEAENIGYVRQAWKDSHLNWSQPKENTGWWFGDDFLFDNNKADDEENKRKWYEIDKLSDLNCELYSKAVKYAPNEEDRFVKESDIPPEYMGIFCSNPDGALLADEEKNIENYLRDIFRNVHELNSSLKYIDSNEDEEYYKTWLSRLAKERAEFDEENYTLYPSEY